jgi:hypothetical protein
MSPEQFPQANKILTPATTEGKDLEKLTVLTDGNQCLSCWRLSWRERLSALIFGRAWTCVFSGTTQPAMWIEVKRKVLP